MSSKATECKRTDEVLRRSREEWETTFDAISDWVVLTDLKGRILRTNRTGENFTGRPLAEIARQSCCKLVHGEDKHIPGCPLAKLLETGERASTELQVPDTDRWLMVTVDPITDEEGKLTGAVHITRDITERKKAEEALRNSENFLSSIIDQSPFSTWIADANGTNIRQNAACRKLFGIDSDEETVGKYNMFSDPVLKEQQEYLKEIKKVFEEGKTVRFTIDYDFSKVKTVKVPKATHTLLDVTIFPIKDANGRVINAVVQHEDITERKEAVERLLEYQGQLKSLASQLTLAEERERRRIATELHDQISQSLVISKMKVDRLRESASGKELNKALDEIANSLGQTIANTRSLTSEIHPPLLALLGFEEAVAEWLSEQIQKKHGIAAEFEDDGLPKPLDDDIRILLFRDVRELLINVVKHAHAHKVKASVRKVGGQIRVSVEDDGVGFDPAEVASIGLETNGFGLFSIQERLEELGGHFEIESEPDHGTRVTITTPLKGEKNAEGRKI